MQNQIIPNGSKVDTEYGVFEVLDCCIAKNKYFCYKKDFVGHSGEAYFGHKYIGTKYEDNCWWFFENEVSLIEESEVNNTKPNYREMKPTDMVKVCVDDNEFEVPLGDLVHATDLLGVTNGSYGFRLWEALNKSLGKEGFVEDLETLIEFRDKQKEALDYFFKPYYDKQQQEKEELHNLISAKQKEVEQLLEKLNQM
jgi:hypothetical protein